jgi:tetratricopeptide (TPR) repeat protein
MAKDNPNKESATRGPVIPTPQEKAKALKWFEHGKTVADTHNYDYAIECYINGLAIWPEAVEEGHKPLRAVGFARLGAGKKRTSILEKLTRFSTSVGTSRDPLQGMLAAEKLLAKEPNDLNHMEAMLKNAAKAGCEQTCMWLGPILLQEALTNPKAHFLKLVTVRQIFEELGDRYNAQGDVTKAIECYEITGKALEGLARAKPDEREFQDQYRDVSGKLTILKGKFEAGDFRESLLDPQKQRDIRDQDRMFQDDSRYAQLIESAMRSMRENPNEPGKVFAVADLMLRRGRPEDEDAAIQLLLEAYERTKTYQFKMRADEVRMRQLRRQVQQMKGQGDEKAAAELLKKMLDFEIEVYLERIHHYPTEVRYKYELGKRYFMAQRFDDAMPMLQQARTDPRNRMACLSLIAQSFYHKGFYDQAINVLLDGIKGYPIEGDEVSKDLHYWLGRAYEAAGQIDAAIQTYGQIIQWDYNYRNGDVRQRLQAAQQQARKPQAGA